jgi:hypothetical protein
MVKTNPEEKKYSRLVNGCCRSHRKIHPAPHVQKEMVQMQMLCLTLLMLKSHSKDQQNTDENFSAQRRTDGKML